MTATIVPGARRDDDGEQHADVPGRRSSDADVRAAPPVAFTSRCGPGVTVCCRAVHDLTSTAGIVAMAAGAVALLALLLSAVLAFKLRRAPRGPADDPGRPASRTWSAHAASLQEQFEALSEYVQDAAERLDRRMETAERRIDGSVAYRALIRYDAYGEMSGRQSTSIALLDATRSGLVLSSIHHRDQARLYAKEVREGKPRARALARGGRGDPARARGRRRQPVRRSRGSLRGDARRLLRPEGTFTQEALIARDRRAARPRAGPLARRSTTR